MPAFRRVGLKSLFSTDYMLPVWAPSAPNRGYRIRKMEDYFSGTRYRRATYAASALVSAAVALACVDAAAAPATSVQSSQVERLLADADSAEKSGNLNLALIQLKNAALLQPENGEVRARLGLALLRTGQAANAERELRQAWKDFGPPELV